MYTIRLSFYKHYKQIFLLIDGHHGVVGPNNDIPVHRPRELNVIHVSTSNDPYNLVEVNRNGVQGLHNRVFRHLGQVTAIVLGCRHIAVVKLECI